MMLQFRAFGQFVATMMCLMLVSLSVGADSNQTYYVSPTGSDSNSGTSSEAPLKTIQRAVAVAEPGDTVSLAPGDYLQDVITVRAGTVEAPITISGPRTAIVRGGGESHIIEVNHDYIIITGFTVNGLHGDPTTADGYRDKLIYAIGTEPDDGVTGLQITHMKLRNAAGECIRLRYFATDNEIAHNTIRTCGVDDFRFDGGGKNGEGVYLGTAPEQLNDGKNPTTDRDASTKNWVHHNVIHTNGNECVDIKEGATANIIEYNTCSGQRDPESGGMDARGDANIFRYNVIRKNRGAGVRLGGDEATDGIDNQVYGNTITKNKNGGIKIQRSPQGSICGNTMTKNKGGNSVGDYGDDYDPTAPCD